MKHSNDTIGDRTRDLPACSAVPQPRAPLRVPTTKANNNNNNNRNENDIEKHIQNAVSSVSPAERTRRDARLRAE